MTIDEFLTKLSATPRNWELIGTCIRTLTESGTELCPITAVEPTLRDATEYDLAATNLDLPEEDAHEIVSASDCLTEYDRELRNQLLTATGLTEETLE